MRNGLFLPLVMIQTTKPKRIVNAVYMPNVIPVDAQPVANLIGV